MSHLVYWIWFSSLRALRGRSRQALLDRFGGVKELFFSAPADLREMADLREEERSALENRSLASAEQTAARCEELGVSVITMQDAAFPERLRNIPDPPSVLYVKGRLPVVDAEAVIAVVGTRRSTEYGNKMARTMGFQIAQGGGTVCTGLAAGVDSRAAEGALMAGGRVIGVLGVAINAVYPRFNGPLYDDVAASGALVSEYPPDAKGSAAWFPLRNRIIAGLSVGTLVVEAPESSGALITAQRALDYGRDVFAVPGNADADGSRGCHRLIREGAALVTSGAEVLSEYTARFPEKLTGGGAKEIPAERTLPEKTGREEREYAAAQEKQSRKPRSRQKGFFKFREPNPRARQRETPALARQLDGLSETQLKIVSVIDRPEMHVDDIVDLSRLPAATVLSELTMLQIKGYVTQSAGKRFSLNIQSK